MADEDRAEVCSGQDLSAHLALIIKEQKISRLTVPNLSRQMCLFSRLLPVSASHLLIVYVQSNLQCGFSGALSFTTMRAVCVLEIAQVDRMGAVVVYQGSVEG